MTDTVELQQRALEIIKVIDDLPEHAKSLAFYRKFKQLCPTDLVDLVLPHWTEKAV